MAVAVAAAAVLLILTPSHRRDGRCCRASGRTTHAAAAVTGVRVCAWCCVQDSSLSASRCHGLSQANPGARSLAQQRGLLVKFDEVGKVLKGAVTDAVLRDLFGCVGCDDAEMLHFTVSAAPTIRARKREREREREERKRSEGSAV